MKEKKNMLLVSHLQNPEKSCKNVDSSWDNMLVGNSWYIEQTKGTQRETFWSTLKKRFQGMNR